MVSEHQQLLHNSHVMGWISHSEELSESRDEAKVKRRPAFSVHSMIVAKVT